MLPIEDRAVRMAQYDTEGNEIGKKFGSTDEAIEELQEALAGKVAFDGELNLSYGINGTFKITPASYGVYKALLNGNTYGVVIVTPGGPNGYYQAGALLYLGDIYSTSTPTQLGLESTISLKSANTTKLYKHTIVGLGKNVVIISPDNTNYKSVSNKSEFFSNAVSMRVDTFSVYSFTGGQYWTLSYISYSTELISASITLNTDDLTDTITPL